MRKLFIASFLYIFVFSVGSNAQLLKKVTKAINNATASTSSSYTEKEAADAIKEALVNGTNNSTTLVSKVDGYYKNTEITIPFPQDAKVVETKLRSIGMGKQIDNVVLTINRAAEDAAKEAAPIFIDAIKNMTVTDAINIVKGDKDAATKYLKKTTSSALCIKFKPIISKSLDKTNATKYWNSVMSTYNKIPLVKQVNPDLVQYVTDKAIEGLFIMIVKEELKIRENPVARTSDLLKKVFGN